MRCDSLAGHLRELSDNSGRQAPLPTLAQRAKNSAINGTEFAPSASSETRNGPRREIRRCLRRGKTPLPFRENNAV